ncbi:MAG: nucleotidyltransferase [Proteobacteria bacterium]|nr:nucleotidyltransferase [Pseudomonadota bacterium]
MTVAEMFEQFLANLAIDNSEQISDRYGEITRCLNKKYRNTESKTANSLQVGSYGRYTAIKGISDLDMIYMMPKSEWERFKDGRQSALLQEVKGAIKDRYSRTDAWGDGQVVVVSFGNQEIEVVPAFEQEDGSFKYPNTNNGGSWPITKPRSEIKAISDLDRDKNSNLRRLCKMARAWKNKHSAQMSGLLIDTLAYNFLKSTTEYDNRSYLYYDWMMRDFFKYLSELQDQEYYLAPGSNQHVLVKKKFQRKAKKSYKLCLAAIESEGQVGVNDKWKKVFGRPFPAAVTNLSEVAVAKSAISWDNTEEFIEDKYPIDIRYNLEIDCEVSQSGYREHTLRYMLQKHFPLLACKKLLFHITQIDVPEPYHIEWKVLNRGAIAERRNQIRGQIVKDDGSYRKEERTLFRGPHIVECYAIRNDVVVAKDRVDVPIETGE